jgi:transcriptional regulator with XRE-family HTH domain
MESGEHIGTRLKRWASDKSISTITFAEQVGVQRSALSHIFSGRNKPSVDVLYKIKNTFPDIDLEWLITGVITNKTDTNIVDKILDNSDLKKRAFTDVTYDNLHTDNQDVSDKKDLISRANIDDVKLIRIIELYSDNSFKSYDL